MITIKATRVDSNQIHSTESVPGLACMNKYGHLGVNINSINKSKLSSNAGNITTGTQRVCLASDDILSTDISTYSIDKRLNSNYRYKTCGTFYTHIDANGFYVPITGVSFVTILALTPPNGRMYIVSNSANDSSSGTGCQSVQLKYIDKFGITQTITSNTNGLNNVYVGSQIGTGDIREILDFKCLTFGTLGSNDGIFKLLNGSNASAAISINRNNYTPFGIEIPQNGYTLLKKITIASLEQTNPNINIELRLILVERYPATFISRVLFSAQCQYQKSITFDLSDFPPISGSKSIDNNFAIYPALKAVGSSTTTTGEIYLDAINVDSGIL